MDNIGKIAYLSFEFMGQPYSIKYLYVMTWVVMALILGFVYFASRRLQNVPKTSQNILEIVYEFIKDLTVSTLGKKSGMTFLPFILMIFIFTLLANWIGILPNIFRLVGIILALGHKFIFQADIPMTLQSWSNISIQPEMTTWYSWLFKVPDFEEPTRSVNTDLAMALMVFIVVHVNAIYRKGFIEYLKGYWGDVIPCHGWWLLLFPINLFIPLNIIGEISSVVSHSFRLFGNIFGGYMIVMIVGSLTKFVLVPVPLLAFFGLFAGVVQAFVFTMLAITYIGQKA